MQKVKLFLSSKKGKDILTVFIIMLVGLGSFGLGRLSTRPQNEALRVEYTDNEANVINTQERAKNRVKDAVSTTSGSFFASSKGKKYYSVGCSAGKTIKKENRIYFNTRDKAEGAGYELSSSCR